MENSHQQKLLSTGVNEKIVNESLKNKKRTELWLQIIDESEVALPCDRAIGNLFYEFTCKMIPQAQDHLKAISQLIGSGDLSSKQQLDLVIKYCKKMTIDQNFNLEELKQECGLGIRITEDQIKDQIKQTFDTHCDELKKLRYAVKKKDYIKEITETLRFADGGKVNELFDLMFKELLGEKTKEDDELIQKVAKIEANKESEKKKKPVGQQNTENAQDEFNQAPTIKITELIARDLADSLNTTASLKWKTDNFGDKIYTRFPPEPNGYLHIGHAKSMRFQFKLAKEYNGHCYLRFDDTNPEAECQEYIDNIKENIDWLGYKPWKVTHASNNFQKLFDFAVQLIKKGKAFVCHQTKQEMSESREKGTPSPYRNRPVEENLKLFLQMRAGLFEEGKAMLRAKIDYQAGNTTLRDPVIYRIRYTPHPHAKNEWCVYPLYDFTHCLCDSLEGITHSICTLEFEIRRELYYWFLKELDLYRPFVWEFSRLNISNNVVSKRKLRELVEKNIVRGWDDPRLLTLIGLRRRGFPATAINEFCDILSVTRSGNENFISYTYLEKVVQRELDSVAKRSLAVVDPVLVKLINLSDDYVSEIQAPDFPKDKNGSTHTITLTNKIYVERDDCQDFSHKDFYGLAPGQVTGLKYGCQITVKEIKKNDKGQIVEILAEADLEMKQKPKAYMNWISNKDAHPCEFRLYDILFNDPNPAALGEAWLEKLNKDSLIVKTNSLMNKNLLGSKQLTTFQFERQGFFTVDYDSNVEKGNYVWNRVTKLADNEKLKALKKIQQEKQ